MCSIRMTRELHGVIVPKLKGLLEPLSDFLQNFFALLRCPGFALLAWNSTTDRACPEADTVETLSNIDNDTHDLVVVLVLKILADGCEHNMEPERIDVDCLFVLELISPFAAVLVLAVFPFRSNAFLEKVVVGLERKIGCGGDVVL